MNPERDEAIAESLAELTRAVIEHSERHQGATRAALLRRFDERVERGPRRRAWWALVPALGLTAALVVWLQRPSALTYAVSGGGERSGSYVSAPAGQALGVSFSDHTELVVEPNSQLRVEATDQHAPRVALERGSARVHVVHRPQTRWKFMAGPFEVYVTGTRFDFTWDPAREVMDLHLREGSVEIQTPLLASPVVLRAGQRFQADFDAPQYDHGRRRGAAASTRAERQRGQRRTRAERCCRGAAAPARGNSERTAERLASAELAQAGGRWEIPGAAEAR
ncbi:MAG: FecR domain-containing protein [Polyangiaceae bacterium]